MNVEAICPLCFRSHVVDEDLRGEELRCEGCEEIFIVSNKAKVTTKKPTHPHKPEAVEEAIALAPAAPAEEIPEAKLAEEPPKKKPKNRDDEEVLEIPDDAMQSPPPPKPAPPPTARRLEDDEERPKKRSRHEEDDDEDDRPRRRPAQRSEGSKGVLIVLLLVGLLGLGGIGFGAWWMLSDKKEDMKEAQADNDSTTTRKDHFDPPKKPTTRDATKKEPPKTDPTTKREPPATKREPPPNTDPPQPLPVKEEWHVKVDPGKAVKLAADFKKEIPYPPSLPLRPDVAFAAGSSPFVMIGGNRNPTDERQIWNLETGEMTGKISGKIVMAGRPVLSSDGARVAYQTQNNPPKISVRPIAADTPISLDIKETAPIDLFDFAGPDRLVLAHRGRDGMTVHVYNATTGRQEREFTTARPGIPSLRDAVAISPGGNYLALVDNDNVRVYDLKTGTAVGLIALAKRLGGLDCAGLSFSPDGSELAALFFSNQGQILCWRVDGGTQTENMTFPQAKPQGNVLNANRGHVIDWIGDRRAWLLYGSTLVDRTKNGSATFLSHPIPVGNYPRHAIGPNHLATLARGAAGGDFVLSVSPFDADKPK